MPPSRSAGGAVSGLNGVKKMVIKPFKVAPKIPENFGLETWDKLKAALNAVYSKSSTLLSKEELYRVCVCLLCAFLVLVSVLWLLCIFCIGLLS